MPWFDSAYTYPTPLPVSRPPLRGPVAKASVTTAALFLSAACTDTPPAVPRADAAALRARLAFPVALSAKAQVEGKRRQLDGAHVRQRGARLALELLGEEGRRLAPGDASPDPDARSAFPTAAPAGG